jgi:crotonobetainyl-CoA:carnitine CoA-transferase CaiB-like acyl-CoA transferase
MQSGELVRFAQRPPAARGGRDFAGPSALDRFYRVSDGWLRVQAPESALVRLLGLLGEGPVTFASEAELAAALGDLLASKSAVEALACLSAAEIPAVVARPPADLITDPDLAPLEMFATHHLQDGTPYYTTNRYARFSRTQERTDFEPPGLGEHSREILSEAGVSPSEIDTLIDSHSVIQGQPFRVAAIQNYR